MGVRERKNHLIGVLSAHVRGGSLTQEKAAGFELMYRRARTPEEQDQVTAAVRAEVDGWKADTDRHSRVLQDVFDTRGRFDDDDDDPPALKAALARSQVSFIRK